jgi:hypothetical protein
VGSSSALALLTAAFFDAAIAVVTFCLLAFCCGDADAEPTSAKTKMERIARTKVLLVCTNEAQTNKVQKL